MVDDRVGRHGGTELPGDRMGWSGPIDGRGQGGELFGIGTHVDIGEVGPCLGQDRAGHRHE